MPGSNSILAREVLVKREATPYTAETLAAGDGVPDVAELGFLDIDFKRLDNANAVKNTWGAPTARFETGAAVQRVRIVVPVRAPAANGSVPPGNLDDLLFAVGLKETITASTRVTYTPQTPSDVDQAQSATLAVYEAGKAHSLVGARGDLTLSGQPGQPLLAAFELAAPWATPTANQSTPAVADPSGAPLTFAGATAVTEDGSAIDIGTFELALQNRVEDHVYAGGVKVLITNFEPVIKVNPFAVASALEWDKLTSATTVAFVANFNGFKLTASKCQLVEMGGEERTGRVARAKVWECKETSGDDHFELEFTASV